MGRILVLLTFAGLVAVFVVIYNAKFEPVQSSVTTNSNGAGQGNTRRTKPGQLDTKKRAQLPRTVPEKGNKYTSKGTAISTDDNTAAAGDQKPVDPGADPLLTVKTDSTPVYTANTKRSKVLRVLRRGEKVRPELEIIDSSGRWRVVRGQPKDRAGFVRDDQIERPPAEGSRKKPVPEPPKQF